jgi:hypothetical protein
MMTTMNTARAIPALLLGLAFASRTAFAVEPLAMDPYDYFTQSALVEELWTVSNGPGVNNLDERRTVTNGEFLIDARSWFSASLSLNVKNPAPVTALRSKVEIHGGTARRCDTEGHDPVVVRASVGGRFFNSPGGDVGAFADIEYTSDVTAIAVSKYRVQYCDDPECTTGALIHSGPLGLLTRKFPTATLMVQWDGTANQFVFQLDEQPAEVVPYALDDDLAPLNYDKKGLQVSQKVPACPPGEVPSARLAAIFDDVFVNAGAAPLVPRAE